MVRVSDGLLEGEVVVNEYGGTYCSFKGIPYAQPPIGNLRFKAPEQPQPWKGVHNAKQFGPVCYQHNAIQPKLENMSEDCLYLNVYTPDIKPVRLLPVMVWIHGGTFVRGSGNDDFYGPDFLIRYGVVVVTFNYRLEALGFLCLDTPDIPGNAGMKDQVAALKWVKRNIGKFGGNPDNITIFGEGAGAASVSYHLISPMTKGLFRRAIIQSGAATNWWSQDFQSREKALLLAEQLGCSSEDDKELYEFFKKQPVETLVDLKLQVLKSQKPYETNFGIADEKDFGQERFFYGDVIDRLQNGIHDGVEIMTGYTHDEGLFGITIAGSLETLITEAKYYTEFYVPKIIKTHCVIADQLEVGRKMRKYYLKDGKITEDAIIKFLSMDMMVYGIMLAAKMYAQKNRVYFYKFNCISERNFFGRCLGLTKVINDRSMVCHGDDLPYLFPIKSVNNGKIDDKSEGYTMVNRVTKLWTNFAKYGNPTPEKFHGVEWMPFTARKQEYLDLSNKLAVDLSPDADEIEFWEGIFKEYLPQYTV